MRRQSIHRLVPAAALVCACAPTASVEARAQDDGDERARPNVVILVADDLGYGDLACYGATDLETPHIDSLARDGVRLTSGYVSGPVCAPTRAGLMTGRYQQRYGYEQYTGSIRKQLANHKGVSTDELFVGELMRRAGYRTAAIGKWHLGLHDEFHPNRRGFDEFFGYLSGGHDFFVWNEPPKGPQGGPILRNDEVAEGEGYITDAFTEEAVRFIERDDERPFFLYFAYAEPHVPYQAPEKYRPEPSGDVRRDMIVSSVRALDESVGKVLAALERKGVAENTLVVFLSDNGSPHVEMNAPFTGNKGSLGEGAVRVPWMMRWPARLPKGTTSDALAIQLDLVPTCVAAAGASLPDDRVYDGVDLVPFLTGAIDRAPHDELFWRFGELRALRAGAHKLMIDAEGDASLYDLTTDFAEAVDLAEERPEEVEALRARLAAWEASLVE